MSTRELVAWLVGRVADATGIAVIDPDRPLQEYGLSSRDTVGLVAELGERVGRVLPSTFGYEHPTIAALAAAATDGAAAVLAAPSIAPGEPIAVVGLGCRLPGGVDSPAEFWDLLETGRDAVGTRPNGRWPGGADDVPAAGGYLDDVAGFDATFFGISPREAAVMDPQQRIVLEVAWAALEHAGIAPGSLRGSRTGVYMGVSAAEYGTMTMADHTAVDAWSGTGAAASIVANRLSYLLDLRGPSLVTDTACSSSLVAVHQAVQGLRHGDADLAVVGGVNVLLTPGITATFDRAGVLAPDGRCKAFDAAADGIVRGEGCGVVVLRKLTDARKAGDRVLAVIRGSATNSDGRSNGLMAPSPAAQHALLAQAYPAAEVDPSTVDYVEAHGTGTLLGDPIEAGALGAVLGAGRGEERPLLIGSVKTNLGHLEGAAGIVGLIKVVLSLAHGRIPPTLHYRSPNPHIDFDALGLRVAATAGEWPRYSGLATAGVSAFGFGGSNAHVVLEEWPAARAGVAAESTRPEVVALSAPTADGVRARAERLADWLESPAGQEIAVADVAGTLAVRRDHLSSRAAVVADDRAELVAGLRALGSPVTADFPEAPVFVFSGFGSSWPGMGRALLAEPAFAAAVDQADLLFRAEAGFSLREALSADTIGEFTVAAPALFGMQVALAELWRANGVVPAAVLGHSVGEVAAAVVAGALDLAQGLRIVVARTALLAGINDSGAGAMAAVELSEAEFTAVADRFPGVGIAVHASPEQLTVTGDPASVAALVSYVDSLGRLAKALKVGGAGHSAAVDPFLDDFRAGLDGIQPSEPRVRCFSSVADEPPAFDVEYWAANLRRPVRFTQAVAAALAAGHRAFVEIAPHPIATAAVEQTAASVGVPVLAVPSLRRDTGVACWLDAAATLHVNGHPKVLAARYPRSPVVDLPGPVWRHEPHWVSARRAPDDRHPLLGDHVELPDDGRHVWQADLGADPLPWLADHRAYGVVVLPGTAFVEVALSAARQALGTDRVAVTDLVLAEFLVPGPDTKLTTVVEPDGRITMSARADGGWVTHATATARRDSSPLTPLPSPPAGEPTDVYAALAAGGQEYGPAFLGLTEVVASPGHAIARVRLPAEAGGHRGFAVHPALADACLQTLVAAALGLPGVHGRYVPTAIGGVRVVGNPAIGVRCVATLRPDGGTLLGTVQLLDEAGGVVVEFSGVRAAALGSAPGSWPELALERRWDPAPLPAAVVQPRSWVVVSDEESPALAAGLVDRVVTPDPSLVPSLLDGRAGVVLIAGPAADPAAAERLLLTAARTAANAGETRLWIVTSGDDPGVACLRGLVRVLAFEHPELRATLLSVDGAEAVAAELNADRDDDEVRWRDGKRLRARLARAQVETAEKLPVRDGAYLVTGGLGELGVQVARLLGDGGATRIVLCGRTARPEAMEALRGVAVEVFLGDIADPGFAEQAVTHATRDGLPLRGVVHAAGVLDDGPAANLTAESIARVWRPKVHGGLRLHEATRHLSLDWWVAFSSVAALVGSPGQAAYATANAWLDALVDQRRAEGLPGITINWGAWTASELSTSTPNDPQPNATPVPEVEAPIDWTRDAPQGRAGVSAGVVSGRGGVRAAAALAELGAAQGLSALAGLLAHDRSGIGVARLDTARTLALFPDLARRPFLSGLIGAAPTVVEPNGWAGLAALREQPDPRAVLQDHLAAVLAALIGAAPDTVDRTAPLTGLGLDSLMAMRLRAAMQRDLGTTPPVSLLLRGASLAAIADHLGEELELPASGAVAAPVAIGPRDPSERWLALAWADALGGDPGSVHRELTDEDAQRRVYEAISNRIADPPPPEVVFKRPTIAAMADLLRADLEGATDGVVNVLRADGDGRPLHLFHPAGGPTSVYRPLVAALREGFPVYGYERIDDESTVEGKAVRYVELLKQNQPRGPYRLGGWSFGGCLAYEIAHLLTEVGETVEQVFLIDTILPKLGGDHDRVLLDRFARFAEHVESTYGVALDLPDDLDTLDEDAQIGVVMRRLAAVPGIGEAVLHHQYTSYVDARVAERYRPRPYAGPVLLLRATDPHPLTTTLDPRYLREDEALGWDELCADLRVVRVPGDHLSMIDPPGVTTLAAALAETEARHG
ncbi:phthiocerol/phenolphthiocerol synthesis type-I polyketide synthase D [Actinokineospora alba]|uniref:Phthiocerol/phenolphthiocerol synthesis type-I polyketide synthase D n=1 Tax=Actinokineospora alba TaxID=504798 RepID=A0A1H0W8D3_9PSEU|nr:type I polyketide synthase [Actinokineospora alba]TDP69980.1 phthiocerol/phenolphthiocerol synthesis type-I polyketide synthase D [Actinokineospora alba]SDJ50625.1 phthiocerol/phenolphthiocerol synthesis type-I polyketide synthase D [Actinokineospora alba]SDP86813.1 phthiocerol/phenolphthiocerol synthesis type-I polyketide synthase D [Actinokineospora alba]